MYNMEDIIIPYILFMFIGGAMPAYAFGSWSNISGKPKPIRVLIVIICFLLWPIAILALVLYLTKEVFSEALFSDSSKWF